jgi:hypothetical protein
MVVRYRFVVCADCGKVLGRYPVFSQGDAEDSGEAEYNGEFGARYEGEDYCADCIKDHIDPEVDWRLALRLDSAWYSWVLRKRREREGMVLDFDDHITVPGTVVA